MSTATLFLVLGGVVCVKTLAFVGFLVRRGRRERAALATAATALASTRASRSAPIPAAVDAASGWRLQWAEPGVLLVENTSDTAAARDVELSATLTPGSGMTATLEHAVHFVATGACFTARFAPVDPWLTACTLSYSMVWRTPGGSCAARSGRDTRSSPSRTSAWPDRPGLTDVSSAWPDPKPTSRRGGGPALSAPAGRAPSTRGRRGGWRAPGATCPGSRR